VKQPGLDKRHRDKTGEISRKKSNTLVRTLRKEYGDDFAKGYRSDAKLGTVMKKEKVDSLHELLKRKR
jgi:hypothetical protein